MYQAASPSEALGGRLDLLLEWTDFALAFERRPVLQVQLHEAPRQRERLFARLRVHDGVAADDLLGLGKWPVGYRDLAVAEPHTGARGGGLQAGAAYEVAALRGLLDELP